MISTLNKVQAITLLQECTKESRVTIVHCLYKAKHSYLNEGWVNIWASTFLVNDDYEEDFQLLQAINVPVAPSKHYFRKSEKFKSFTLIFPALPKSWEKFSLIEVTASPDSGFRIYKIVRTNSGVYHITI
jgi:hypothetical protein